MKAICVLLAYARESETNFGVNHLLTVEHKRGRVSGSVLTMYGAPEPTYGTGERWRAAGVYWRQPMPVVGQAVIGLFLSVYSYA